MIENPFGLLIIILLSFIVVLAIVIVTYYAVMNIYEHYKLKIKKLRELK